MKRFFFCYVVYLLFFLIQRAQRASFFFAGWGKGNYLWGLNFCNVKEELLTFLDPHTWTSQCWPTSKDLYTSALCVSNSVMVSKIDWQTYKSEFESRLVPYLYGLVPHLSKKAL